MQHRCQSSKGTQVGRLLLSKKNNKLLWQWLGTTLLPKLLTLHICFVHSPPPLPGIIGQRPVPMDWSLHLCPLILYAVCGLRVAASSPALEFAAHVPPTRWVIWQCFGCTVAGYHHTCARVVLNTTTNGFPEPTQPSKLVI